MHHGAGVGLRKTELGPRLLPNSISGSDPSLIFSGFDQSPAASRWRFPAFLPGSGQKVEVIENTPLNPVYPVLELHVRRSRNATLFCPSSLLTSLQDSARLC
jgi:hypothetical protein